MKKDEIVYTTGEGLLTRHMYIRNENPKGLVVMLPGGNNISDRPIMHFTRKGVLDSGYDVLNIDYTGFLEECDEVETFVSRLVDFVGQVFEEVIYKYEGKRVHLFARSMGSVVGARIVRSGKYKIEKVAFVSPTGLTFKTISNELCCRVYFDPNDTHLKTIKYDEIISMDNVEKREFEGANHNFEYKNNIQKTIEVTGMVVLDVIEYLTSE